MTRVIRVMSAKLHPSAICQDCPKEWSSSGGTREFAKDHAQQTGHSVEVVTSTVDRYRREGTHGQDH